VTLPLTRPPVGATTRGETDTAPVSWRCSAAAVSA